MNMLHFALIVLTGSAVLFGLAVAAGRLVAWWRFRQFMKED
jgi:hypothetical protein